MKLQVLPELEGFDNTAFPGRGLGAARGVYAPMSQPSGWGSSKANNNLWLLHGEQW